MDITAASVVYTNHFYAPPNYVGDQLQPESPQQNQSQIMHTSYVVSSGPGLGLGLGSGHSATMGSGSGLSPRSAYNDLYRFEDGSGDASGSLLIGQHEEDFCEVNEESQVSTSSSSSCQVEPKTLDIEGEPQSDLCLNLFQKGEMENQNQKGNGNDDDDGDDDDDDDDSDDDDDEVGEGDQYQSAMVDTAPYIVYPPPLPLSPYSPYMTVGQELYVIQPETVFVLGMRLNVTKNEIMIFFGKLGLIKLDEITGKPKIFVYKNKLTGRSKGEATITYVSPYSAQAAINCLGGSKFMGQTLSVLPAYLSMRKGSSVRYSYPRDLNPAELQRRQRLPKWKPASDNWVCLLCRNSNFVWRSSCNRCQASKHESETQGQSGSGSQPMEDTPGLAKTESGSLSDRGQRPHKDWPCGFCFNMNFWYRLKCNRCQAPRSEALATSESEEPWELVLNPPSNE
ncbi:RNA-binding protein EWS [Drosophila serrata]|uniref:RNA-binding protein EWS n=1 Tax=Drosophila serrata TaxID=7274 RepID=UPI000A1D10CF|nr:RNA-binding protein EWS [Drosophila serrata]